MVIRLASSFLGVMVRLSLVYCREPDGRVSPIWGQLYAFAACTAGLVYCLVYHIVTQQNAGDSRWLKHQKWWIKNGYPPSDFLFFGGPDYVFAIVSFVAVSSGKIGRVKATLSRPNLARELPWCFCTYFFFAGHCGATGDISSGFSNSKKNPRDKQRGG